MCFLSSGDGGGSSLRSMLVIARSAVGATPMFNISRSTTTNRTSANIPRSIEPSFLSRLVRYRLATEKQSPAITER